MSGQQGCSPPKDPLKNVDEVYLRITPTNGMGSMLQEKDHYLQEEDAVSEQHLSAGNWPRHQKT